MRPAPIMPRGCLEALCRPDFAVFVAVRRFPDPKHPEFKQLPFRQRLAWRLRHLADWWDGDTSHGYQIWAPEYITPEERHDALLHSMESVQRYITDLVNERNVR